MRLSVDNKDHQSYINPEFDSEHVYRLFKEVIVDRYEFYKENMTRLQRISMNQKGRDTAVKVIEQTAVLGSKHMVDESLHEKRLDQYFLSFYFFFFFLMALAFGNYHYNS